MISVKLVDYQIIIYDTPRVLSNPNLLLLENVHTAEFGL
jgi:hypothetical protein